MDRVVPDYTVSPVLVNVVNVSAFRIMAASHRFQQAQSVHVEHAGDVHSNIRCHATCSLCCDSVAAMFHHP